MNTNNTHWKFESNSYPPQNENSLLAEIFESARRLAPLHLGSVHTFSIKNDEFITVNCVWKIEHHQLGIEITFKGVWTRGMQVLLPAYFLDGLFNGTEGFGHVQKFEMTQVLITLSASPEARKNSFAKLIYFLEEKRK